MLYHKLEIHQNKGKMDYHLEYVSTFCLNYYKQQQKDNVYLSCDQLIHDFIIVVAGIYHFQNTIL